MSLITQAAADSLIVLDDWGEAFSIVGVADSTFTAVLEEMRGESEWNQSLNTSDTFEMLYNPADAYASTLRSQMQVERASDSERFVIDHASRGRAACRQVTEHLRGGAG